MLSVIEIAKKHRSGNYFEAAHAYEKLLLLKPKDAEILNLYGLCLTSMGNFDQSISQFSKAILVLPKNSEFFQNRAIALACKGDLTQALLDFKQAAQISPLNIFSLSKVAELSLLLGDPYQARDYFTKALRIDPKNAENRFGLANSLNQISVEDINNQRLNSAISQLSIAKELAPNEWEISFNLGNAHLHSENFEMAKIAYKNSLRIKDDSAEAHCNLGISLERLGEFRSAINSYEKAITLKPDFSDAKFNLSLLLLKTGNYKDGFRLYEERWKSTKFLGSQIEYSAPLWLGLEDILNKTILCHSEQGFGDTIQFIRFCSILHEKGAKVLVKCPNSLISTLSAALTKASFYGPEDELPIFDFHCPLMSLPLALGISSPSEVYRPPYISTPASCVKKWESYFDDFTLPRVGLVLEGKKSHQNDHLRSIKSGEIIDFLPAGVDYFILQKELSPELKAMAGSRAYIHCCADLLEDFGDTAAACNQMDLIFSVDTSVAHLAGALGNKIFLLLHFQSDWRWQLNNSKTYWYPKMKIIRLARGKEWPSIFNIVEAKIIQLTKTQ
ncbi:tetratricopeptide repeat protein [Alphaproteobacteria bacterium]|nr:tetratricopeptide repeat protein [Alphaproteobacteria bacterium]MDC1120298.1 tetratricopeptide repeat protein [Alphaproteobacteria bacterium]